MEHATFVIASYVVTFVSIATYAAWVLRSGRRLSAQTPDEEKTWT